MNIKAKKREIKKKNANHPPQSYRPNFNDQNKLTNLINEMSSPQNDFKSHSLKNSQSIKRSKLNVSE